MQLDRQPVQSAQPRARELHHALRARTGKLAAKGLSADVLLHHDRPSGVKA
jgi:hypothetical protein